MHETAAAEFSKIKSETSKQLVWLTKQKQFFLRMSEREGGDKSYNVRTLLHTVL